MCEDPILLKKTYEVIFVFPGDKKFTRDPWC